MNSCSEQLITKKRKRVRKIVKIMFHIGNKVLDVAFSPRCNAGNRSDMIYHYRKTAGTKGNWALYITLPRKNVLVVLIFKNFSL
jgi:hypothetical protein